MPKRVLAIGVGGSGKSSLTILKERLEETYGSVPDNVVLLSLDTDDLRDVDVFAGTALSGQFDDRGREPEFRHVTSKAGVTMQTVFADIAQGRTTSYMSWLENEKLQQILGPAEMDIRGGAQQRRPVGRVALFQRWDNPITSSIIEAIQRVYGEPEDEQAVDSVKMEQSKRLIFIIGSVAGGTGSGFLIDVINLVRHVVQSNTKWQSVDVSAIVVLPDAFSSYTTKMNDPSNLKPNSYAALREMDRFIRTHSTALPYMIRYDEDLRSVTWSTNQPLDHVYLVDTASPSTIGDSSLVGDPQRGVFPLIADFVMAHVDQSLGDALATLRSNAGLHYDKTEGWNYNSFNIMSYIFPVDDVIESFSYRFLRDIIADQYLPITDKKENAVLEQLALKETEQLFSANTVGGKVNPGVVQKAIAATRKVNPETPDVSWNGLFNLIALSESGFAQDLDDLNKWLAWVTSNLVPSKEGEYRHEGYEDGNTRLLNFADHALDECLGPQVDRDDEESRQGGEFDKILGRYREEMRKRFAEAVDAALLDLLNRRDSDPDKTLLNHRLPFGRSTVACLREKLLHFKALLAEEYRRLEIDTRNRQTGENLRYAIAQMQNDKDRSLGLFGKPKARKAQDNFIGLCREKMELALHQRIYKVVIDVLDALGAAEQDSDRGTSVLDIIGLELENWQATFREVDRLLDRRWRAHEKNREEKRQIKVRRYLTNPTFEDQLYSRPEHVDAVGARVLGRVRGDKGITWQRVDDQLPLNYKLVTMWTQEASGAEEIAGRFFIGVKELFQVVRENVTVAERVAAEFRSPASFVNVVGQVNEPFLRYNPSANGKAMFHERYTSFNLGRASNEARKFLEQARATLRDQGANVDITAESLVACTVAEVARGARLGAVDQFVACETEYRAKLYRGKESLHLFPEEQIATDYEGRIEALGEPDNRQRPLSPQLVIAMGDEAKLRAFTLACAYGLVHDGLYWDPATGAESNEIYLTVQQNGNVRELLLSNRRAVRELDKEFDRVTAEDQRARLYLNALQNFVLKATAKPGVPDQMVATLVDTLKRRGVALAQIDNPFTLQVKDVYENIKRVVDALGPVNVEDQKARDAANARLRVEQCLQPFLTHEVIGLTDDRKKQYGFKRSPAARVRDMGTVMHLILANEINQQNARASSPAGTGPRLPRL